jgi:hypothetical protein
MIEYDQLVIRARATLRDIEPPIWRLLLLPQDLNLAQLHEILQAAFGWTDSHLHQFIIGGLVYGAPEFDAGYEDDRTTFEATEVPLRDFEFVHAPPQFLYEYDFGDSWIHEITFEELIPPQPGVKYPTCTDGARHGPPEDAGGPWGYQHFLEAWRDPAHEDHKDMRRWAGPRFDPEAFNRASVNKAIASALRKCKRGYRFRLER